MYNGFHDKLGLKKHHHPIDLLAEANALFSGFALYPQLFKILSTGHSADLAPSTFFITLVANFVWHLYGWHRRALPIIISSALVMIASGVILALILLWK